MNLESSPRPAEERQSVAVVALQTFVESGALISRDAFGVLRSMSPEERAEVAGEVLEQVAEAENEGSNQRKRWLKRLGGTASYALLEQMTHQQGQAVPGTKLGLQTVVNSEGRHSSYDLGKLLAREA